MFLLKEGDKIFRSCCFRKRGNYKRKDFFCQRLTVPRTKKASSKFFRILLLLQEMRTLLRGIELGEKKPSQLLRDMKALAGENATEGLLRTLWLQRMPMRIQEMILIFDGANLEKLAECADKLVDYLTTVDIHAVQTTAPNPQDPVQLLIKQVAALSTKMEKFTKRNRF